MAAGRETPLMTSFPEPGVDDSDVSTDIALQLLAWLVHFIAFRHVYGELEASHSSRQWSVHDGCQTRRVHCLTSRYYLSLFCISSSCQSLNLAWKARGLQDLHTEEIACTEVVKIWS